MIWHALKPLRRKLRGDRRGNVAILGAFSLPALIGILALGVDWSHLVFQKRQQQADTDLAAIVAASRLSDPNSLLADYLASNDLALAIVSPDEFNDPAKPLAELALSGLDGMITAVPGRYTPSRDIDRSMRFVENAASPNAVRIDLRKMGDIRFASAFTGPPTIQTSAIAGLDSQAAFSVGTRLASLNDGLLNAVLSQTLGTTVSLNVMDYRALLDADVDLLTLFDKTATHLNLTAGTYDDVLDSELTLGKLFAIVATLPDLDVDAKRAIDSIGVLRMPTSKFKLGQLFDLNSLGANARGINNRLTAKVGVADLLSAAAAVSDGKRQVVVDLGTTIPGIGSAKLSLYIGQPPEGYTWFALGPTNTLVRTAQTRLALVAQVGGTGMLSGVAVRLPLFLEVAYGEAGIASVSCDASNRIDTVSVDARPGVLDAWIGEPPAGDMADWNLSGSFRPAEAKFVETALLTVEGRAHADISNPKFDRLTFSATEIADGEVKSTSTRSLAAPLIKSLLRDLDLNVRIAGYSLLGHDLYSSAVENLLSDAVTPLDTAIMNILAVMGVRIGEADVRVTGGYCGRPVLVQ